MPASQPSTGLSIDLSVFSRETAEARLRPFSGKGVRSPRHVRGLYRRRDRTRGPRGVRRFRGQAAEAPHGARSRSDQQACRGPGRKRRPGPPGGLLPVYRSDVHPYPVRSGHVLPFAVPLAGKPVVLAGRRKPGPVRQVPHGSGGSQRSYAPVPRRRTGPKSSNGWAARRRVASSVC